MGQTPSSAAILDRRIIEWSGLDEVLPSRVISDAPREQRMASPDSVEKLSSVLRWANKTGAVISVMGGGTKKGWGNRGVVPDLLLSTEKMSCLIEHAWQDMTFTVQAGMKISELQQALAQHGQCLVLDPLWPGRSTIGGMIASNDSGTLRLRYGSVRDLILGATIVLANGTVARSGGKVVKNVAGYDLPKLLTGSMGTLAVIVEATFRAHPLSRASRSLMFRFADFAEAQQFILSLNNSNLVPVAMQLRAAAGTDVIVDIRFDGVPAGVDAQTASAIAISSGAQHEEVSETIWQTRETLFPAGEDNVVAKLSVLPSRIAELCEVVARSFGGWKVIMQGTGLGLARLQASPGQDLLALLRAFQREVRQLGGTTVVLEAPDEIRAKMDVYGFTSDAHSLMLRVKQQFDPNGILNRGRFVGGI